MADARTIKSTMGVFTAGDGSDKALDHSWWYTPLDFSGRAPADPDSATRINNLNKWLGSYNAESKKYVGKFLYCPNGGNSIPIYFGAASDPLVDWKGPTKLRTPRNAPKPGSTGAGTRNGHLMLFDPSSGWCIGTGYDGWSSEEFRLNSKGIKAGIFDGTSGNDGPRGRSPWAKTLMMREFQQEKSFEHRMGMGWPIGARVDRTKFGTGPNAFRTKQYAWPMTGNDGGGIYAVQGSVFRIKPDVNLEAWSWQSELAHAIAKAMQKYGAVVQDGAGNYTGGPLIDGYSGKSLEVVSRVPITPDKWEWVKPGYDPRDGSTR